MSSTYNFSTYNFESPKDFTMPVRIYQTLSRNISIPVSVKIRFYPEKSFFLGIGGNENVNSIVDVLFNLNDMGFNSSNISYSRVEYPLCNSYMVLMDGVKYNFDYCIGLNLLQMLDLFRSDEINVRNNCALIGINFFDIPNDCYVDLLGNDLNTVLGSSKFIYDDILKNQNNVLLQSLIDKLDTLDNLNILSSADFSPLLNLSTFADLVGSLNPVLAKQVSALDVLNVYASTLQPVRAKFGQPVEPLSKTDKVYSFIDYNHMTINRLITNQSKNSKIYLYDVSSSKLLKVLYDIDYSMTFDVKDYKSLRIVFDANDYVIDKAL